MRVVGRARRCYRNEAKKRVAADPEELRVTRLGAAKRPTLEQDLRVSFAPPLKKRAHCARRAMSRSRAPMSTGIFSLERERELC
jgi:hypothetical protein